MQTTSGKVKLATAEEVDNMASSISGGLGGTLIGTTTVYINVDNGRTITTIVPSDTDYIVIKPIGLNGSPMDSSTSPGSTWVSTFIGNGILVYNNGSGFVPSAVPYAGTGNNLGPNTTISSYAASNAAAAVVTLNAATVTFTSKCSNPNQYVYVNIEAYQFK